MRIDDTDVLVEGDGPQSIVLVHGWPDTHRLWDRHVEVLRQQYRCVRFTLPGFAPGAPRRAHSLDELVDFLRRVVEQACDGGPVTLLLHDWGCVFGYRFAQCHPERVRRVVGVDVGDAGSRRYMQETSFGSKLAIVAYQIWLAAAWRIGGRVGDWMARKMARAAGAPAAPAAIGAQMGYPYYVQWVRRGYRKARVFVPSCPMLFVYGRRKPFMFHSQAWAAGLAAREGSRVLGFDTGHWVMVEAPEPFNRAVVDWLRQGDGAG